MPQKYVYWSKILCSSILLICHGVQQQNKSLFYGLVIQVNHFSNLLFQVLINVCDQVVERSSKFLTQRSRPNSAKLITTSELCSMANLVELLNKESVRMTERVMPGLILSLQGLSRNELGTV